MIVKFIQKYWLILAWILLSIILPIIWFRSDFIYLSEEDLFANYQRLIYKNLFAWSNEVNIGIPAHPSEITQVVPNGIFYFLLSQLNVPNFVTQRIFLSLVLFMTFISISHLLSIFTKNKIAIFASGLFYYFNFYVKSSLFYSPKMYQLIVMPLLYVFTYTFIKTGQKKYVFYSFILLLTLQGLFANLATLLVTLSVIPIAVFVQFAEGTDGIVKYAHKVIKAVAFLILILSPLFILNAFIYYQSFFATDIFNMAKASQTFSALTAPLSLILQFRGAWWEFGGFEGASYNPWLWFYSHPAIIVISFIFVLIIFFQIIYRVANRTILSWTIVYLVSLLFATGSSFIPQIYNWFFNHIPLFYIFREPWAKFMPITVLSSTVLLCIFLHSLKKNIFIYFFLFLIVIRSFPFFSPNFFDYNSQRWLMPFVRLPLYWQDFEKWSRTNKEKMVLSIPINYFKRDWYAEDLGNASHPLFRVFGYTKIMYELNNNALGSLIRYFREHNNPNFIKITSVDYALDQRDIPTDPNDPPQTTTFYSNSLLEFFESTPTFNFSNKLLLKPIKNIYKLPLIYAPNDIFISGDIEDLMHIVSQSHYKALSAILLKNLNRQKLTSLAMFDELAHLQPPKIIYDFYNPTRYKIRVENAKGLFLLVLNESYHPGWKLTSENTYDQLVTEKYHLVNNGYSNAWIVDPKIICKNSALMCSNDSANSYSFNLELRYAPQRLFINLLVLNIIVVASGVVYLCIKRLKNKNVT